MSKKVLGKPVPLSRHMRSIVHVIKVMEDAMHVVVAVLLATLGGGLIIYTLRHIAAALIGPRNLPAIVSTIVPADLNEILLLFNEILLLFIVAELLNAVAIAVEHGGP